MNPSKDFLDSCEGGNVFSNMVNTLMNPELHHQFLNIGDDHLHDTWEEAEAEAHHDQLAEHWDAHDPNLEHIWANPDSNQLEEAWHENPGPLDPMLEKEYIRETAGSIMYALSAQNDPKFQNSEFFKFVERLHSGKAKIQDGQVVEDFGDIWNEPAHKEQEKVWNGLTEEEKSYFDQVWKESHPEDEEEINEEELLKQWGAAWDKPQEHEMIKDNPYEYTVENPFELAQLKLQQGHYADAIALLEVVLKREPENSAAWLLYGKAFSDVDRDDRASFCFKSGLAIDPYNIDQLLCMCTSSVNTYDHNLLAEYFTRWLTLNSEYSGLIVPEGATLEILQQVYMTASEINPNDPNVYMAMGIMEFVANNYYAAEYYFEMATKFKPGDVEIINKIGVAMTKQGKYEEAAEVFKTCIEIKPGFVKAWVNLGLNIINFEGDYKRGIECFLIAATVYPSDHLFEYCRTYLKLMDREDLIPLLDRKDPSAFEDEFVIVYPLRGKF